MIYNIFRKNQWFFIPYFFFLFMGGIILILFRKTDIHIFINNIHNASTDYYFKYLTYLGDGFTIFIAILLFSLINYRTTLTLTISTLLSSITIIIFKQALLKDISRPVRVFQNIQELYLVPGVDVHASNSFPSGHTATAFILFLLLSIITKNNFLKFVFFLIALSVGYSRMYLSQHFLIDIYFGSIIGVTCTILAFYWCRDLSKKGLDHSLFQSLRIRT